MTYEVIGWQASWVDVAYLIPLTLVNVTSLGLLILSLFRPETVSEDSMDICRDGVIDACAETSSWTTFE